MIASYEQAKLVRDQLVDELKDNENVTGIGIGRDDEGFFVKVNLGSDPRSWELFPNSVASVRVLWFVTGVPSLEA